MPELPEAERARQTLEAVLGRRVVQVQDADTYVCRPHQPGELNHALTGHRLTSAHRRGKFLWLETDGGEGPVLGLHLGMTGRIVLEDVEPHPLYDRFAVELEGGSRFALRDKRRLGRALLNPDFRHVGPDAAEVDRETFRRVIGAGRGPVKARLLDQGAMAGIGNLLADQALWQARISPERTTGGLSNDELDRLRRDIRQSVRSAIRRGGAHTGEFIPAREAGGHCPRCGSALSRARIGGRTTYWCPACQT